jgi:intraflagellar transport protein 56
MYPQAEEEAMRGPESALRTRILFNLAYKLNDENKLMMQHQKLTDTKEDQLCLAAIHYMRSHFQEVSVQEL